MRLGAPIRKGIFREKKNPEIHSPYSERLGKKGRIDKNPKSEKCEFNHFRILEGEIRKRRLLPCPYILHLSQHGGKHTKVNLILYWLELREISYSVPLVCFQDTDTPTGSPRGPVWPLNWKPEAPRGPPWQVA